MQTKSKSNSVVTHRIDGSFITFNVLGAGSVEMDLRTISNENREKAEMHGWIQRVSDAAAISRDSETGQPATPQQKLDAMKRLVDHYESGTTEWSRKPIAGENMGGLLLQALVIMSPSKSVEEVREWMKTKSKAQLNVIRMSEKVAAVINKIRPVSDVDVDEELSELGIE